MMLSRRRLLKTGSAAAAALAFPEWSFAEVSLGDMTVQTVSDGSLVLPFDFIFEPVPEEIRAATVGAFDLDGQTLQPPCNLTLVRQGSNVILFDAGSGSTFQPSAGQIVDALDAAGVAPEDVTHVVFTHAHPDHIWGVLDDFDEPVFYEAEHLIGRREFDYWMDPNTVDTIGAARQAFAVGAARRLEAMADRLTFFEDGEEILPNIAAVMTPGHTPGHMSFEARSGGDALMIVGDAIGNHHIALTHPGLPLGSDQEMEEAAATRSALIDRLVTEDIRIAGFHLPDGGLGRLDRSGEGYVFIAET
jgi:glyoxylase-like metal-dependent hydrolase (beta-lactamase superfamily II)